MTWRRPGSDAAPCPDGSDADCAWLTPAPSSVISASHIVVLRTICAISGLILGLSKGRRRLGRRPELLGDKATQGWPPRTGLGFYLGKRIRTARFIPERCPSINSSSWLRTVFVPHEPPSIVRSTAATDRADQSRNARSSET